MEYSIEEELEEQMKINKDLQQRIDKAIAYLEKFVPIDTDTIILTERQREYIISILQDEEVKDNEL